MNIHEKTAIELTELVARKELSVTDIVMHFIERIEKYNDDINAIISFNKDDVINQALLLDEKIQCGQNFGKLCGVVVAVKDNIHVNEHKTTCCSKVLENYSPYSDATVVELLKAEGAIVIGKTNMDEFAMGSLTNRSMFGPVKNPWNHEFSAGGSSGGSAAALTAGFCTIALGSDTGGSVRQPAGLTGLHGYKPSYGGFSRHGLIPLASSLDQIGLLAKSVDDVWFISRIIGKACTRDALCDGLAKRHHENINEENHENYKINIAFDVETILAADQDTSTEFDKILSKLKNNPDFLINEANLNDLFDVSCEMYHIICAAESFNLLARFDGSLFGVRGPGKTYKDFALSTRDLLGEEVKIRSVFGNMVVAEKFDENNTYYEHATKLRNIINVRMNKIFQTNDIIITPTTATSSLKLYEKLSENAASSLDKYTIVANATGSPAISIPLSIDSNGIPIGFHIIGSYGKDYELLSIAKKIFNIIHQN